MEESSIAELIVSYAERETAAEEEMKALEDRLNILEIGNHQPLPHIAYYAPDSAYYKKHQPASGIPPTINVPPPDQNQWTGQATFQKYGQ